MVVLLNGPWKRVSNTPIWSNWSVRPSPIKKMSMLELSMSNRLVAWNSSILVVYPLTSPWTTMATTISWLLRTAPSTSALPRSPSDTPSTTTAIWAQSTVLGATPSGTLTIVQSSSLVLMIGLCVCGMKRNLNPSLFVITSKLCNSRLTISAGRPRLLPYLHQWQTMDVLRFGISRKTL